MDNENNFEFASQNSFKKSSIKHTSGGFGKSVFVPFISGILGASLVMGVCFGIPTIKQNLFNTTDRKPCFCISFGIKLDYLNSIR